MASWNAGYDETHGGAEAMATNGGGKDKKKKKKGGGKGKGKDCFNCGAKDGHTWRNGPQPLKPELAAKLQNESRKGGGHVTFDRLGLFAAGLAAVTRPMPGSGLQLDNC